MSAKEVRDSYTMDSNGRITDPGKFEGEPIFAPYYWAMGLEGFADSDDGRVYTFKFAHSVNTGRKQCSEFDDWPELKKWLGRKRTLKLHEDSVGFVHCY